MEFFASIITAAKFAVQGLQKAVRTERAFRQELIFFVPGTVIAAVIARGPGEFALLVLPFIAVLCLELVNSAIEKAIDRIGTERDSLAEDAKDYAAAAVFLANGTTAVIWLVYLVGRWWPDGSS